MSRRFLSQNLQPTREAEQAELPNVGRLLKSGFQKSGFIFGSGLEPKATKPVASKSQAKSDSTIVVSGFSFRKVREREIKARHAAKARKKVAAVNVSKLKELSDEERDERSSLTFVDYVKRVQPRYRWYPHCLILARILQMVADGKIKRLMVFMPPRHGKSEEISRLFSSYYVYRFPERHVGLASYSAGLAYKLSLAARDNYTLAGGELRDDANAVNHWHTPYGGSLWATGVGGPATGKGYHLGIVDDPVKNAEEASSAVRRAKHKEWWDSVWSTRDEPDAAQIVVQTRWHEDDLSGYLLHLEQEDAEFALAVGDDPDDDEPQITEHDGWHIVNFPAICEEPKERVTFPSTCTVEPEFRSPGEALCPERYSVKKLLRRKRKMLAYYWNAIFQQRPKAIEGNKFKRSHFEEKVDVLPYGDGVKRVRYWDLAKATSKSADYTVGARLSLWRGYVIVEDVVRFRKSPHERNLEMRATAERDTLECGRPVKTYIEYAPGLAEEAIENIIKDLKGHSVEVDRPSGDKVSRAEPFQTYCEAGNVAIKRAPWNSDYVEELIAFDSAPHDDQVDASSGAFKKLTEQVEEVEFLGWI